MKLIPQNENRPGYKETKIGWIPDEWRDTVLADISKINAENLTDKTEENYTFYYLDLSCIEKGNINLPNSKISYAKAPSRARRKLKENDVILSTVRPYLKGFGIADFEVKDIICSTGFALITIEKNSTPYFVYSILFSEMFSKQFYSLTVGSNYPALNNFDVERLKLPLPPLPEQKKIAAILSTWDKAISNYELLIKNYELRKKGLMQKLLSGEVRFPGFTEPWQEVSLGEVFNERREANLQHLPLLAITGSAGVVNRDDLDRRDTSNKDKSKYKRICPGDIGYNTMRMWQGVSALSDLEGIVSPAYTIVTPKKEINALFASYLFKHHPVIFLFYRYSQGLVSDTWNLKFRHFSEVRVKIPSSLNEQIKIASLFKNIDDEVSILKQKKNSIEQQKKGLMQKLLTGTVRVKPIKN